MEMDGDTVPIETLYLFLNHAKNHNFNTHVKQEVIIEPQQTVHGTKLSCPEISCESSWFTEQGTNGTVLVVTY